ncbi:MAG: M23 family metallopeptidase [Actinobacteria bacterium]|nr:M23 family metallopeptidase [Actinomycetota bacterium]MBU1494365.1 M23 family metallopeptidase [Actinomycetota bacterium]
MEKPRRRRRVAVIVLLASLFAGTALPAWSVTDEDVEQARRQREAAAAERAAALTDLDAAVAAYEAINVEFAELTFRIGQLRSLMDSYQQQSDDLQDQVRNRAVEAYMHGDRSEGTILFATGSIEQAVMAQEILAKSVEGEVESLDSLLAARAEMERLEAELDDDSERLADLRFEAELVAARMNELFAEAEAQLAQADSVLASTEAELAEQRRREEEERRRQEEERLRLEAIARAAAGPAGGIALSLTPGFICPVDGISRFVDSWGAPRSGGRTHKGTDLMAAQGTRLVAVANGTVSLGFNSLGGNTVWVHADYGVGFFYAHLDTFAEGLRNGDRVSIGQVLGTVGDTGNAAPGAYHLHFGMAVGGGASNVNPYPSLRAVCP